MYDTTKFQASPELIKLAKDLREVQRAFFKSTPGTDARRAHLAKSKQLEKILDDFLTTQTPAAPVQKELF